MTRPRKKEKPRNRAKEKWSKFVSNSEKGRRWKKERKTQKTKDLEIIKQNPKLLEYYLKIQATLGPNPSGKEINKCLQMIKDFVKEKKIKWSA